MLSTIIMTSRLDQDGLLACSFLYQVKKGPFCICVMGCIYSYCMGRRNALHWMVF